MPGATATALTPQTAAAASVLSHVCSGKHPLPTLAVPASFFVCAAEVQGTDVLGKGFMGAAVMAPQMHTGKGDVNVDVQCTDVCNDVCTPIPQKVCNDVPYQTQVRHTRAAAHP